MSHRHNEDSIEGLIERNENGEWIARMSPTDSLTVIVTCKVDFCPWCGEKLE